MHNRGDFIIIADKAELTIQLMHTSTHKRGDFLKKTTTQIRKNIIEMLVPKESHHIGCSLSIVEILTSLYFQQMSIDPKKPIDPKRDIFILSKGHAAAALYATLAERGFFDKKILAQYDTEGGLLPEHVTRVVPGIELSTGSLGHGLPVGVGFALSSRNDKKKNHVYVLVSDGELDEGSSWEAILFAGHHKLSNLIVIVDYNKLQGFGTTHEVLDLEPLSAKLKAFGWNVYDVDGHDFGDLDNVFEKIKNSQDGSPHFVIANTIKGKGIAHFEGKFESHYHSIDEVTKETLLEEFNK